MDKTVLASFTILCLLTTVFLMASSFNIQTVKASGTIYIRADGSIDPPTANIATANNVTYTFTSNITESIVVEKSDITIDGKGYTRLGLGDVIGFHITDVNNVTIQNTEIQNFYLCGVYLDDSSNNTISGNNITNNGGGIWLYGSSNNTISGNNITNNEYGIYLDDSSDNNTISGNNITNHNDYGIWLDRSSDNTVSGNNITANNQYGIRLYGSSDNTVSGNNITNNHYGIDLSSSSGNTFRNNDASDNKYNFFVYGTLPSDFIHDMDDSNTVDGKPVHYWVNRKDMTVPVDAGYVALVNCTRITVKNLTLTNNGQGVLLAFTTNSTITKNNVTNNKYGIRLSNSSSNTVSGNNITNNEYGIYLLYSSDNNTISGNNITNNYYGIVLYGSSNNTISGNNITNNNRGIRLDRSSGNTVSGNNITANVYYGIGFSGSSYNTISGNNITANNQYGIRLFVFSNNNTISGNNITNNGGGIRLYGSSNNTISGNNITNNDYGVSLDDSSNNMIFHNNLVDNAQQVHFYMSRVNFWDNGFEGNYWSDYAGSDLDNDGIGDFPLVLDVNNTDNHPLMGMFSEFNATTKHHVQTICNSTISTFNFNGTAISFNASGENGTAGFCRIYIPRALMNETYKVFVNGTEVPYTLLPCSNSTHSYLYFTYNHSTQEVTIIPEFPSLFILPLFMIATLLAAIVYRRRHQLEYKFCVIGFVPADVVRLKKDVWFSKLNSEQVDSVDQFLAGSGYP